MSEERLFGRMSSAAGRQWTIGGTLIILAALTLPSVAAAATLRFEETVMSGLVNPRGLAFGPDASLYVAEAGRGGDGPTIVAGSGEQQSYGSSGAITRLRNGSQQRIVTGLPSLAGSSGAAATGPQDLAFGGNGALHALIGLGADSDARDVTLAGEEGANLLGTLVKIENGTATSIADVARHEADNNPDGTGTDSNPFGLAALGDGFLVTDAGGNDVLAIDGTGATRTAAVLPPTVNPLFPGLGGPTYQAVPTGAALGPDGALAFGQLTGFPFPANVAQIFGLDGNTLSVLADGLTNIIDVAFGLDGSLYALELDSDSLLAPGTTGALYAIGANGAPKLLFGSLETPTSLAVGADGDFYVSINGNSPTDGSVIRLAPVPLPAALPLLMGCLALVAALRRRRPARTSGALLA